MSPIRAPHAPFLFSHKVPTPKGVERLTSPYPREGWASFCLLIFRSWLLHNQEKKSKRRREKKIKKKIKELIAIQTSFRFTGRLFLKKKDQYQRWLFQTNLKWIPIEAVLTQLRKNLFSFISSFKEKNYETDMWFNHIFNFSIKFSMYSISAYEVFYIFAYMI